MRALKTAIDSKRTKLGLGVMAVDMVTTVVVCAGVVGFEGSMGFVTRLI